MKLNYKWPLINDNISNSDRVALSEFLLSNQRLTNGEKVKEFEKIWSNWLGVRGSTMLNSGSSGNYISIAIVKELLGIGEVIVPPLGWVSDVSSIVQLGMKPVFVDISLDNLSITTENIKQAITDETKAIVIVHCLGFNAIDDELIQITKDKNIILIVRSDNFWGSGPRSTVAHEFFHTVQYSLTGPQFTVHGGPMTDLSSKRIPRWLIEGSANYYAIYVNQKLKLSTYQEVRKSQLSDSTYNKNQIESLHQYDYLAKPELNPYGIGQAATEYLVASVGFESLLNIFKYTNSKGNFSAGFKKAVGISIEDFYLKFNSATGSMNLGTSNYY
jgi:hypothetical protein